jgi:hypothetical protein
MNLLIKNFIFLEKMCFILLEVRVIQYILIILIISTLIYFCYKTIRYIRNKSKTKFAFIFNVFLSLIIVYFCSFLMWFISNLFSI